MKSAKNWYSHTRPSNGTDWILVRLAPSDESMARMRLRLPGWCAVVKLTDTLLAPTTGRAFGRRCTARNRVKFIGLSSMAGARICSP